MIDLLRFQRAFQRENLFFFTWQVFKALHSHDAFIDAWHVRAMCVALQAVAEGRKKRLLITVPPRHLKSICTSVAYIAWLLGHKPHLKVIVASYGQDLADKHARDFLTVVESQWYRRLFPAMQIKSKRLSDPQVLTTLGGGRKAVSLGGAVTGFGADVLVIDDLMKAADARLESERERVKVYYDETLFSRLNDKQNGPIIAIQQRLHEDDLAAYLLDKGNFEHLNLKAIAEEDETFDIGDGHVHHRRRGEALFPEREPLETLEAIRREIGSAAFSAQYQQNPVPPGGNLFRWGWFSTYDTCPDRNAMQLVVQSWDTAMTAEPTSDYSVCSTWGLRENKWYLLDLFRGRLEYAELKRKIQQLRASWRADRVIIEYAGSGIPLWQEFRAEHGNELFAYKPIVDKETRLIAQSTKLETGNYLIPREAPWLAELKHELLAFPSGRYDDQVDSITQFLDWIGSSRARGWCERRIHGRPLGRPRPTTRRAR